MSEQSNIHLYNISNLNEPTHIKTYNLSSNANRELKFSQHGMQCIEKDGNKIKLLLFGGRGIAFIESFVEIMINFKDDATFDDINSIRNTIDFDNKINIAQSTIDLFHTNQNLDIDRCYDFGFVSIVNGENQRCIVIVGGDGYQDSDQSIMLYNCHTQHIDMFENVRVCI